MTWVRILGLLGIAGIAWSCADGSSGQPGDEAAPTAEVDGGLVAAQVDGRPVWVQEVQRLSDRTGEDPRAALHALVVQRLLAAEARRRGFGASVEVENTRWRAMAYRLIEKEVLEPNAPDALTEAEIREAYGQDPAYHRPHTRTIAHILSRRILQENEGKPGPKVELTPERKEALNALSKDVAQRLAEAARPITTFEAFKALKEDFERQYGSQGIYFRFERIPDIREKDDKLAKEFVDEGFRIPGPGRTGGPIWTHVGWHVLFVVDDKPGLEVPLEEVRNDVIGKIVTQRRKDALESLMTRLEANTTWRIEDDFFMFRDAGHAPE